MDELEEIEAGLRSGLRHVAAPPGFTQSVMRRIAERQATRVVQNPGAPRLARVFTMAHRRTPWWTAAAAVVALAVGGGDLLHVRHQRQVREAEQARAQVDLALQLTSHALNEVQTGLERSPAGRFTRFLQDTQR